MFNSQSLSIILGLALLASCGGKKSSGGGAAPAPVVKDDDSKNNTAGDKKPTGDDKAPTGDQKPGDVAEEEDGGGGVGEDGGDEEGGPAEYSFYMGYDGNTPFSILLPGDYFSLKNASDAKLETIDFTPSVAVKSELLDFLKAQPEYKAGDEQDFEGYFLADQSAMKISSTKEGNFTLIDKDFPDDKITVVVNKYPEGALALGKKRYETDGAGNLKACKSCHETGANDAPPHELGEIMYCSDTQIKRWITTGVTDCYGDDYSASIPHSWGFASDAEITGVIAYLRSKQSKDYETLTKFQFKLDVKYYYSGDEGESVP